MAHSPAARRYTALGFAAIAGAVWLSFPSTDVVGQQAPPANLTPAEQAERVARTGASVPVQEGRARVQTRGQPMKELGPGEVDYAPPGVEHWHGAAPNEPLLQLGVVPYGGGIKFLEPVTDAQYNGQAR